MDWVDRPKNYKGLYGILQLLQGSHLDNFSLKTLKLGWVAFHPRTFQLKCLDFQSYQYKKLTPVLSRFCNGLWYFCVTIFWCMEGSRIVFHSLCTENMFCQEFLNCLCTCCLSMHLLPNMLGVDFLSRVGWWGARE